VLVRLTFKAVAAFGTSAITVTDTTNGPGAAPTIVAGNAVPYPPSPVQDGTIVIGSACTTATPTPTPTPTATAAATSTPTPTPAPIAKGDVNCDGLVNVVDALFVFQYDVGLRGPSSTCPPAVGTLYLPACDVNGDGVCNVVDGLFIEQCDVGIHNVLCP
jgi:hypothetical protein